MAKVKISQLPDLNVATLDTTYVVGVSGSTTYKISISKLTSSLDTTFATDLVVNAISGTINTLATNTSVNTLSSSIDSRLDTLESFSSSADNRYILSGSITQTTWDNIANKPNDIVSSSTQIADLGFVTGAYTTINEFNNLTQSFTSISQSFTTISSSVGGVDFSGINAVTESYLIFTQSYYNESSSFSSRIEAATNEQYLEGFATTASFNTLSTSVNSRLDTLEEFSSSLDNRYILSGSITQTTWDNIANKPNDIVSSSTQITELGFISESTDISSLNSYTASLKNAINFSGIGTSSVTTIYGNLHIEGLTTTTSASNLAVANNFIYLNDSSSITNPDLGIAGNYNDGTYAHSGIFSDASDGHKWKVFKGYQPEPSQSIDTNDASFQLADFVANNIYGDLHGNVYATNGILSSSLGFVSTASYNSDSASFSSRIEAATNGVISGSSQISALGFISTSTDLSSLNTISASYLTFTQSYYSDSASFSTRIAAATNEQYLGGYLTTSSYTTDSASFNSRIISGSAVAGTISSSAQITALGFISTSVSLTSLNNISASYLTFTQSYYTDSSSFSSRINNITASVNINTGSFVSTSSFNAFTASAQMVTTGSNAFNGTQTITGSLIITSGSFIGSQIVANTSSLYLTSGSNMYVQNNGIVEITGSLIVNGTARFATVGGDEGGEIEFGVPQTNTSLSTRVVADIFQNRFRIFDGNTNGVYVDLSKAPTGVNGEITWKVSGYVNAGTFVQLDNVKVTIPTSGNRGASIGAVSTSFTANISATFGNSAGTGGNAANTVSYTTTAAASAFGWNFGAAGDAATYILNDTTNSRVYRIITMIGTSYNNNFISIERLH